MRVWFFTHRGKVRQRNEDALLVGREVIRKELMEEPMCIDTEERLFAVADGLGGHARGDVASYEVLNVLAQEQPRDEKSLLNALWKAKEHLLDYVRKHPSALGLGTALAGVILKDEENLIFSVGDCRVYVKDEEEFLKVSRDHTLVEDLVIAGRIKEEDARLHPRRHVLTSAILGDESDFELYTKRIPNLGKPILLCSDGFWEEFSKEEMKLFASSKDPIKTVFEKLESKAQRDNVSFLYIEHLGSPS
ncbi:PP2C family protein-serine/threonine phosphatase [Thermocrinis sp.]